MKRLVARKFYRTTCKHCGCEFEYEKSDLEYKPSPFVTRACKLSWCGKLSPFTKCPICGKDVVAIPDENSVVTVQVEKKENQTMVADGSLVNEIANMQWKIDRMEELLRRLYFYSKGKESRPMIPITDMADIDHYTAELIKFIKEHTKAE